VPEGVPPDEPQHARIVIVGAGPAGLTAAIYAARAELAPIVLGGHMPGGQLMLTTRVENFPGFPSGIDGPELMSRFRRQAEHFGARVLEVEAEALDLSGPPFHVVASGGRRYVADSVIVTTGARSRSLGLANESRLLGRGVSSCGTCDGAFFRGQEVAVVGGGDAAVEEAIGLTRFAARVHLVHRGRSLRASRVLQTRLAANPRVDVLLETEVVAIFGEERVESLEIAPFGGGDRRRLDATGLFVAIGLDPETDLLRTWLPIGPDGYLVGGAANAIPGIFVAGDISDRHYRQAVTAAADGCRAALDAEHWLLTRESRVVPPATAAPAPIRRTTPAPGAVVGQHGTLRRRRVTTATRTPSRSSR
jgi:thioredoxin reductase (NADPH)